MLFNGLPQRALCVHYSLSSRKRLLFLQWLSMVWVYRGKQMNGLSHAKVCAVEMGQMCTVSQCRLLFTFKDSPSENALGWTVQL